ncbi:MAG: hypothetical protein P4L34_04870 [Paludibacter sp.]|nr:hypothetical protein [Paludibacter sp.]
MRSRISTRTLLKKDKKRAETAVSATRSVHWLADVHSGSFAPAFTLSFHDSERSRKPPNAHSLGR